MLTIELESPLMHAVDHTSHTLSVYYKVVILHTINMHTVKPLERGHFGTVAFVLSLEVVLFLEVALLNSIQYV